MVSASRRARNSGQGRAERPPTRDRRVSQKDAEKPRHNDDDFGKKSSRVILARLLL
jgi:hypothetical protein